MPTLSLVLVSIALVAIAGIIRYDGEVAEQEIREMNDSMTRRGPDDSGVFVKGGVALSHRRLSIIDVSTGHQPMAVGDGSVVKNCILMNNVFVGNNVRLENCIVESRTKIADGTCIAGDPDNILVIS